MEITSSLHVGTHLDSPRHFTTSDIGIGEIPLDFLVGPACVVDLCAAGIADFDVFGPDTGGLGALNIYRAVANQHRPRDIQI